MDDKILESLAGGIGTPSYIFDTDQFESRTNLVKTVFGEKVDICFSIKANPFLLCNLPKAFSKIEVCSPGELTICEKVGIDMSKVIFSGVNKTEKDIDRAMNNSVGVFTVESYLHLDLINKSAIKKGMTVPVLIRLTGGSQFGMDENDIEDIVRNREEYKGVKIIGIHYFTGTQKRKAKTIIKELDYVMGFIDGIREKYNFTFDNLEYGTGLAVDYFAENAYELEEERLNSIAGKIREVGEKIHLTVEMGRFFACTCGYYLTKVIDAKTNHGVNYCIVDGGINHIKYDGQIQGMQIPEIYHIGEKKSDLKSWTICGSLCTTADVLARNVELDNLRIGDILVFKRTGAYSSTEGMAIFLSREMPRILLYSQKSGIKIVRDFIYSDIVNTPI